MISRNGPYGGMPILLQRLMSLSHVVRRLTPLLRRIDYAVSYTIAYAET